jgi:hypothetical protein
MKLENSGFQLSGNTILMLSPASNFKLQAVSGLPFDARDFFDSYRDRNGHIFRFRHLPEEFERCKSFCMVPRTLLRVHRIVMTSL